MLNAHKLLGTALGVGYLPKAPGTWGSLLALALYFIFFPSSSSLLIHAVFFIIIAAVFGLGVVSATRLEKVYGHDPSCVVIDEVVGLWIALWFLPKTWIVMIGAFVLFRFFDITKWFGINRLQDLPKGWGVMMDDVLAGIWANVILQIVVRIY